MTTPLDILYADPYFIAVNKPEGMLVHRSRISADTVFVLQALRDQVGAPVFTIHRLDRATSGVLIYAASAEAAESLAAAFREKIIDKKYLAIVRGWTDETGTIDYAVRDQDKPGAPLLEAVTHYRTLGRSEAPLAIGYKYATARFSLVEVQTETGRRHQIRKHFAHILHPLIGDKRHGDNKHNRYFWNELALPRMFLHAHTLEFTHPYTGERLRLQAPVDELFQRALQVLELAPYLPVPG
ncbi:MAG: pseudouridylate synthase [Saprospirales bacterium]|jgi:tRNA pseudouridine65 synthase|nr:pseudouridylate synthase [Saprospirales bacterium]